MASHIWIGGAPVSAQVKTVTIPADVEEGQVFTALFDGKALFTYTFPAGITRIDAVNNIVAAWNASTVPEVAEIVAAAVSTTGVAEPELTGDITFTARTAGKGYSATFTIGDGGNEIQVVTLTGTVTGGTFTLSYGGYTTAGLAYNASAATIQTALEGLTSIGASNVSVSGSAGGPWTVEFIGALAATNVDLMTADGSNLTGTNEVQTISLASNISGGTFTLSFASETTGAIAYNASAATIQSELEGLSLIGSGNVSVSGSGPWTVTFQGALGKTDVATLYLDDTSLTGGLSVSVVETTAGGGSINERHAFYIEEQSGTDAIASILGDASVTAGTFTITFSGIGTTAAIAYDASVEDIQDAIKAALYLVGKPVVSIRGMSAGTSLAAGATLALQIAGEYAAGMTITVNNSLTGGTYSASSPTGGIAPTGTLSSGSYYIKLGTVQSADISIGATKSQITAILEDMSNVGTGNVQVNFGSLNVGASGGGYEIEFIGALANSNTGLTPTIGSNSGVAGFASMTAFKVYTGGGGTDEVQTLSISGSPVSGQFALEYEGVRTSLLDYNATASEVQTALRALPNIGASGCSCSGGDLPGTAVVITFSGELGGTALTEITAVDGTVIETTTGGGNPDVDVETTQAPLTTVDTTANSGPNNWDVAANWSSNSVPSSSDTVYIADSDVDILYGLDQSAVTLAALHVEQTFTGTIGLPRINTDGNSYYEYRDQYLKIGATELFIGDKEGDGSERIKIDLGSVQSTVLITDSGDSPDGNTPPILLLGTHASNVINVNRGFLGVAYYPTEVATVATLRQAFFDDAEDDTTVYLGDGVTVTNITKTGGVLDINSGTTSFQQTAGTTTIHDGAHTVLNILAGLVNYNSTGTLAAVNLSGDAVLVFDQDARPKTVTVINKYSDESEVYDESGSIANPVIQLHNCGDMSTLFMGKDFKLTFSATT